MNYVNLLYIFFNKHGLKTIMCCQGHGNKGSSQHKFWIEFSKEVKDKDIENFLSKLPQPLYGLHDGMQLIGQFKKIYLGYCNNKLHFNWRYEVDLTGNCLSNQKLAMRDLLIFEKAYKNI